MNVKDYPYEKTVLLNAAYDVLERMAIPLRYTDSRAGLLRFGTEGEIALTAILRDGSEITRVEIVSAEPALSDALLDELHATLEQNFASKGRNEP